MQNRNLKIISKTLFLVVVIIYAVLITSAFVVDSKNLDIYTLAKYIKYRNILLVIGCVLAVLNLVINSKIRKK